MTLILNLIWLICGGFVCAILWFLGGLILAVTIIGLPWAFGAWRIGAFTLWPFGHEPVDASTFLGRDDPVSGCLGMILNLVWLLVIGWVIALAHLSVALVQAISIIGLPFAYKHVQLAGLTLAPIGKRIIPRG